MNITRAAKTRGPSGSLSWTVVDDIGMPIEVVDQYVLWLKVNGRSVNTLRAYAHHLALLFRWLLVHRTDWAEVTFDQLAAFMTDLAAGLPPLTKRGGGERDGDSVRAVAAAVREFYEFHKLEGRGPADLVLTNTIVRSAKSKYHLLAHVEQRDSVATNRLARSAKAKSAKARASQIEIIGFEADFQVLLDAARTKRDELLLSSCYDVGLRVGQSLGLRHSDLDFMRKRVRVQSFASSADVYIHLANSDLEDKLKATEHLIWPETPDRMVDA